MRKKKRIQELEKKNESLRREVIDWRAEIAKLSAHIEKLEAEIDKLQKEVDEKPTKYEMLWDMYISALNMAVEYREEAEYLFTEKYERIMESDTFIPIKKQEKFLRDNYEKYKRIKKGDIYEHISRKV